MFTFRPPAVLPNPEALIAVFWIENFYFLTSTASTIRFPPPNCKCKRRLSQRTGRELILMGTFSRIAELCHYLTFFLRASISTEAVISELLAWRVIINEFEIPFTQTDMFAFLLWKACTDAEHWILNISDNDGGWTN